MRQLQVFVAASRARSFSDAASKLGISQPSLSGTIGKIEEQLGFRLFDRTTRSLLLTADGRDLAALAEDLVRDFEAALRGIAARSAGKRGRVSIAVLPSIAAAVLPQALSAFAREFAEIDLTVHDVLQDRAVNMLRDGIVDFAVTTQTATYPELEFNELATDPFILVCRRNHPLAQQKIIRWRAAAEYPFIALSPNTSVRRFADAAMAQAHAAVRPRYEVELIASAVNLVAAGLGITALPGLTLATFRAAKVVVRPLEEPTIHRSLGILKLKERSLSAPARFLHEHVAVSLASASRVVLQSNRKPSKVG
ncbi:LysR family transcriptional regulator [Bradyrhizobium sp. ARR65]|uniref:LysR family transcriptional regulator n=1 Tax=Bradyrhizobium sp. ARR65 TaxID=1040989 RepID=UPI0018DC238F|nr:LysR family transcriptional regulator [Bradyrhizobium sp. ARR65]